MENASKALLIAGGVLISIIVISTFILGMRKIAAFQETQADAKVEQQTLEFNNLYESYNRNNIRGNDIISLMNRIVDYNATKTADGYTAMHVTFTISSDIRRRITFDDTNRLVTQPNGIYTEENIGEIVGTPTSISGDISGGKIRDLETKYGQKYCNQLASEISTIDKISTSGWTSSYIDQYVAENFKFPKKVSQYGGINQMLEDAKLYYEYVQFKKAYFNCTGTEYDDNTGRLINMEFVCTGIGV